MVCDVGSPPKWLSKDGRNSLFFCENSWSFVVIRGSTAFSRNNKVTWLVYIILCSDKSLYTGITIDVTRRFNQHAKGQGAKYFRCRQPIQLVYVEIGHDRSSATKREISIKKLPRHKKLQLVHSDHNKVSAFLL
jgi:putative endonuclease